MDHLLDSFLSQQDNWERDADDEHLIGVMNRLLRNGNIAIALEDEYIAALDLGGTIVFGYGKDLLEMIRSLNENLKVLDLV